MSYLHCSYFDRQGRLIEVHVSAGSNTEALPSAGEELRELLALVAPDMVRQARAAAAAQIREAAKESDDYYLSALHYAAEDLRDAVELAVASDETAANDAATAAMIYLAVGDMDHASAMAEAVAKHHPGEQQMDIAKAVLFLVGRLRALRSTA